MKRGVIWRRLLTQVVVVSVLGPVMAGMLAQSQLASAHAVHQTPVNEQGLVVRSYVHNPHTGQDIALTVQVHEEYNQNGSVKITYQVGVPKMLFDQPPNVAGFSPLASTNRNSCDSSVSWCVNLTQYYDVYTPPGANCIALQSPAYTAVWTRLDSSVIASNAQMNQGVLTASPHCDGARYGHDRSFIGTPVIGATYSYTPYWGSFKADVGYPNAYQCGDTVTTLTRHGSTWTWVLEVGEGTCPNGAY